MNQTERFYKIIQLLEARRCVSRQQFLDELEISPATFKRDLEYLRDRFQAPIDYDPQLRGYRLVQDDTAEKFVLPGLWFNAGEVHALLTMEHLLENLQPGLLAPYIAPLKARIQTLLEEGGDHSAADMRERIRILHMGARRVEPESFSTISRALLSRKRLAISHYNRRRDEESRREVSPQRLVYYRDNWYLDAWCHLRKAIRSFSLDTIRSAEVLTTAARSVSTARLDDILSAGYGIFGGRETRTARLHFNPERARWVAAETWHPAQVGTLLPDGSYRLEFPYSDDRELVMDILKHGEHVTVEKPKALRDRVRAALALALEQYS